MIFRLLNNEVANLARRLGKNIYKERLQLQYANNGYPFWFSTTNYYVLTTAISIASFFIIWGLLHGTEDTMPWITAGIVASLFMISAVVVREFVLRNILSKRIHAQKQLDYQLKSVYKQRTNNTKSDRLTLERNSEILTNIENKSQNAKSAGNYPERHLEVFELCNAYLQKSQKELNGILKESPRYLVLRNGRQRVQEIHKYHLLSWAAIESQVFIQNSKFQSGMNEKIENAQRAFGVIDSALKFYPDEEKLLDSIVSVREYIVSVKVNHWIEQAERAEFKENYQRAINHYKDALFFLARENDRKDEHNIIAQEILEKIEILRKKSGD
jgi:hypothetical protein